VAELLGLIVAVGCTVAVGILVILHELVEMVVAPCTATAAWEDTSTIGTFVPVDMWIASVVDAMMGAGYVRVVVGEDAPPTSTPMHREFMSAPAP